MLIILMYINVSTAFSTFVTDSSYKSFIRSIAIQIRSVQINLHLQSFHSLVSKRYGIGKKITQQIFFNEGMTRPFLRTWVGERIGHFESYTTQLEIKLIWNEYAINYTKEVLQMAISINIKINYTKEVVQMAIYNKQYIGKSLELLTFQIHFFFNFLDAISLAFEAHKRDRMYHLQFLRRKSGL